MQPKSVALAFFAAFLSACASSSVYHPAEYSGGEGFTERRLGEGRYRVTFRGNASTPRETVEDYLLLHAAEIALQEGKAGFLITEADTDEERQVRTYRHPAFYGRVVHVGPRRSFPYYAYGYDWGYPEDYGYMETRKFVAVAYISLLDTDAVRGDAKAFDARDVVENIGPVSCYRKEPHDESECPLAHDHD